MNFFKEKTYNKNTFKKQYILWLLAFVCIQTALFSQVSTSIDTTTIRIGEEITFAVQVEADTTDLVVFPEGQAFLPLEVIASYPADTLLKDERFLLTKKYGLTHFDSGAYTLPTQRIFINNQRFLTDSILIEVRDVVVDTSKQKLFDIKPRIEIDSPLFKVQWLWWLLIPLGLLVALFLYFKQRKQQNQKPLLPPFEEALKALDALKAQQSSTTKTQNSQKQFYSSLTEIIKRYLSREDVAPQAIESTSEELITQLQLLKDAGAFDFNTERLHRLNKLLSRADLVKFAKATFAEGQWLEDFQTVTNFIEETKTLIPEPDEDTLLQDQAYAKAKRLKRTQRLALKLTGIVVLAALISGVLYGSIFGFQNLKDLVLGNPLRELNETQWVRSEYGSPAIIINTPDVLIRVEDSLQTAYPYYSHFQLGKPNEKLFVSLKSYTTRQAEKQELDLQLERTLQQLEANQAKNLIVKTDDFETEKGIKGKRAFGRFTLAQTNEERHYELFVFAQGQGIQKILIVYENDSREFGETIKNRIVQSIELEITETQG